MVLKQWFIEASNWIWENRKRIPPFGFDYPDYGGMPGRLSRRLSPEFVDAIQELTMIDPTYLSAVRSKKKLLDELSCAPGVLATAIDLQELVRLCEAAHDVAAPSRTRR